MAAIQPLGHAATALQWQNGQAHRFANVAVPTAGKPGFSLLPPQTTAVTFTNRLSDEAAARNRILENGSGVALGDIDGDGWCDIYFCRLEGPNALFRNLGDWRFEDITDAAGVACADQYSTGALIGDVNGDGKLDLLVNSIGGGTRLFLNDGAAHFTEFKESGLARQFGAMSMAMADIDGDGDLELYIANYRANTFKDAPPGLVRPQTKKVGDRIIATPEDRWAAVITKNGATRLREIGEPDILYVNKGQGRFGPISWTGGAFADSDGIRLTEIPRDWGLSVMFRDINGDGSPDIYVCNDFFYSPDRFWLNEAGRRFLAPARVALRNMSMSAMTVDFADINRDGFDDFFVADMLSREHSSRHRQRANINLMRDVDVPVTNPEFRPEVIRNTLFLNRGDGTYAEIAQFAGLAATEWTWSAIFIDVDLDGFEDLLITNGNDRDVLDADSLRETAQAGKSVDQHLKDLQKFPRLETANLAFRNRGDLSFEEIGAQWGFNLRGVSHGMALADLDNDGDLDVVVNNLNSAAALYRNDSPAPRVAVRLRGKEPNTRGIGAKIKVTGGPITQTQEIISGGRYLSCDEAARTFAAGSATNELTIEVTWRNGARSLVERAKPNRIYEIAETDQTQPPAATPTGPQPWFSDVSASLNHTHHDEMFDDFLRQPLLPKKLSGLGPGVSWFDVNNDGWEDLIVGSGKGAASAIFENDTKGGFRPMALGEPAARDQTTLLGLKRADGQTLLLVGSANYEDGLATAGACVRQFNFTSGAVDDSLSASGSSPGSLCLADIDDDGVLDLFVAGRVIAGHWPESADSRIYKSVNGQFQLDAANNKTLEKVGLVSGAAWADLDGDGWADLILACEWGPIRVFKNDHGRLNDITATLGLDKFTGWWNGVNVADLDADGKLDIIASNSGLNIAHRAEPMRPARIYYGDLLQRQTIDIIEAEYDEEAGAIAPVRPFDVLGSVLPALRDRYNTFRAFGRTTVAEILEPYPSRAKELQATTSASMIFFNRPGAFQGVVLPSEAQFSPAFAVTVADIDADGADDIFLSQNFFQTQLEVSRFDAGRGLWLRNEGAGKLSPVPGQQSGIKIYGEQRGAAVCDFNHDGRADLVVAQNAGPTRLFLNQHPKHGLRVTLRGSSGNPEAVGAQMRLIYAHDKKGPCRSIQAGSGYWSQDAAVQILGLSAKPESLWIRWPGGYEQTVPIEPNASSLTVTLKQ